MTRQAERLKRMMKRVGRDRGVKIVYRRGVKATGEIDAIPTHTNYLVGKTESFRTKYIEREYIVELALLVLDGEAVKPKSGDRIVEGDRHYEVIEGDAKQCYRPMDSTETFIRIFCQRTK